MLYESLAFTPPPDHTCREGDPSSPSRTSVSMSTASSEALSRAYGALSKLSNLAHFLNSTPDHISRCPPFLPLCFFVGTRFLLALNSINFQLSTDDSLNSLTRALGALSTHYREAGTYRS